MLCTLRLVFFLSLLQRSNKSYNQNICLKSYNQNNNNNNNNNKKPTQAVCSPPTVNNWLFCYLFLNLHCN